MKANAKINLTLDIVGISGGFHMLRTVMHELPVYDTLCFEFGGDGQSVETSLPFIKSESNIALLAIKSFYKFTGLAPEGIRVYIEKRIPVGAGMGGGSADAACVLRVLNQRYDFPISDNRLIELGQTLGADVPFMLQGGAALCEGKGELMTPLPTLPPCTIVVVKPLQSISTADAFRHYDRQPSRGKARPDTDGLIAALMSRDLTAAARRVYNVMEKPSSQICGEIAELHMRLLRLGADGAAMSGSGSAVYGIFSSRTAAAASYAEFEREATENRAFMVEINED